MFATRRLRDPTDRQLRIFALCLAGTLGVLCWRVVPPWPVVRLIAAVVGGGVIVLAIGSPQRLRPLFFGLSGLTAPLGAVVGEVLLLTLYFGLFLPIGWGRFIMNQTAFPKQFDRASESYWQLRPEAPPPESYFRQS